MPLIVASDLVKPSLAKNSRVGEGESDFPRLAKACEFPSISPSCAQSRLVWFPDMGL